MNKRVFTIGLATLGLSLSISACGAKNSSTDSSDTATSKEYDTVSAPDSATESQADAVTADTSTSDASEKEASKSKPITVKLNTPITNDFMETTLTKASYSYELNPSDTSSAYVYMQGTDGQKYFYVEGNFKNLAGYSAEPDNSIVKFKFDDKYEYTGTVYEDSGTDINQFFSVNPLETVKIYIAAQVPDEIIDSYSSVTVDWMMDDMFGSTDSSHYQYVQEDTVQYDYQLNLKK